MWGFRQASAVLRIKQKWTFYCRVNIGAKDEQHSEGKFRKSTDACSKTPTSISVWSASHVKCDIEGM